MPFVKFASSNDSEDYPSTCRIEETIRRQTLLNKLQDIVQRAQEQETKLSSLLEWFNDKQDTLEFEMKKVSETMISIEQMEDMQATLNKFLLDKDCNVRRLRGLCEKLLTIGAKQNIKAIEKSRSRKEYLPPSLVKSIQSLRNCPSVKEMIADSNVGQEYSSHLVNVINDIPKTGSCSPAMNKAVKSAILTIENLNKAFQERSNEVKRLSRLAEKEGQENITEIAKADLDEVDTSQLRKNQPLRKGQQYSHLQKKREGEERYTKMALKVDLQCPTPSPYDILPPIQKSRHDLPPVSQTVLSPVNQTVLSSVNQTVLPPVSQTVLSPINQTVQETKLLPEDQTLDYKTQRDFQSPSRVHISCSSVKSFARPQVRKTKVDAVERPIKISADKAQRNHQSLSRPLSALKSSAKCKGQKVKTPMTETEFEQTSTVNSETAVSGNFEEQYTKIEEDAEKLLRTAQMVGEKHIIDVHAQSNNLNHLNRALLREDISPEEYNLSKGHIQHTLGSVGLRLGCLLQRYVKHVQMQKLRKTLDEDFKLAKEFKDGQALKKRTSQLCKFQKYQQNVKNIWEAKQAAINEERRLSIARTSCLFQEMNRIHGLHLGGISRCQKHVLLPPLTVTPIRIRSATHLHAAQRLKSAPEKVRPATVHQNHRTLDCVDVPRKPPGTAVKFATCRILETDENQIKLCSTTGIKKSTGNRKHRNMN